MWPLYRAGRVGGATVVMFVGDGVHRDQRCTACGDLWTQVPVDELGQVCGRCRGWHDEADAERGAAAVATLVAAVAAQRASKGTRWLG